MEETQSYLALQDWYDIDSVNVVNLLSATDNQQSTPTAPLFCLQSIQDERNICPISQQVYHFRETHVHRVGRSMKWVPSLQDASEDSGIPKFEQLFCAQVEVDWGHEVSGLVLGYD